MNPHQIRRLFPNASKSLIAANAADFGAHDQTGTRLPDAQPAQQAGALVGDDAREAPRSGRPCVVFTLHRVQLLDTDAKHGSCKDLLDGLAYAGLIPGDREDQITLDVRQEKVAGYKEEKTVIEITYP